MKIVSVLQIGVDAKALVSVMGVGGGGRNLFLLILILGFIYFFNVWLHPSIHLSPVCASVRTVIQYYLFTTFDEPVWPRGTLGW